MVKKELKSRPEYKGKFYPQEHFLGYEGRCCFPSNFDANYCYTLGFLAALAVRDRLTGAIAAVKNLYKTVDRWELKIIPLVHMMHLEIRGNKEKPVICKTLVDLKSKPFVYFTREKILWELEDHYRYPGPIQFAGEGENCEAVPITLR